MQQEQSMKEEEEVEEDVPCPLCVGTGPPQPRIHKQPTGEVDELLWVECTGCQQWFHTVCVLKAGRSYRATVPAEAVKQMRLTGMGVWFDWTGFVDQWNCATCQKKLDDQEKNRRANAVARPSMSCCVDAAIQTVIEDPLELLASAATAVPEHPPSPPPSNGHDEPSRPKRQAALNRPDYLAMHNHEGTPTSLWLDLISEPEKYGVQILDGRVLTRHWVESTPSVPSSRNSSPLSEISGEQSYPCHLSPTLFYGDQREPLLCRANDGGFESLGGKVPSKSMDVTEIARLVGPERTVDVIDVSTQSSSQWTMAKWANYVKSRSDPTQPTSSKIYNIISLEISGTELAKRVRPPTLVREIDWVDNFWNFGIKGKGEEVKCEEAETNGKKSPPIWPKVQMYCLMGMKGSWTDWHVDFAASSVYYTIHTGSKVFYFIRPTETNLQAYAKWSGSQELQHTTWLGNMCDEVRKVVLQAGDTMIIPSGYIHAVYTPMDSIVFGGNFLHSYDIPTQLRLRQIEIDTKVPQRFRFPQFDKLCWYVAAQYTSDLRNQRSYRPKAKPPIHPRILQGLVELAKFLMRQVGILEDESQEDKKRKAIWDRIPTEIVGDPSGLAVEFSWRVGREMGEGKGFSLGEEVVDWFLHFEDGKKEVVKNVVTKGKRKVVGNGAGAGQIPVVGQKRSRRVRGGGVGVDGNVGENGISINVTSNDFV